MILEIVGISAMLISVVTATTATVLHVERRLARKKAKRAEPLVSLDSLLSEEGRA